MPYSAIEFVGARMVRWFCLLLTLVGSSWPAAAAAQDSWDRVVLRTGGLLTNFGSDIRVDPEVGPNGTAVDLENDLGFNSSARTIVAEAIWRVNPRHQVRANFFTANRDVARVLIDRTITVRDTTFDVNAQLDAFLDTSYLSVDYGYVFVMKPRAEFGATIGLTAMRFHLGIGASGSAGSQSVSRNLTEDAEFTAPVPLPGLFANLRPHPRVTINGTLRFIKAKIGSIDGNMSEARAGVDVLLTRRFGVGAAYYFNHAAIGRNGKLFDGRVVYGFNGPQLNAVLVF